MKIIIIFFIPDVINKNLITLEKLIQIIIIILLKDIFTPENINKEFNYPEWNYYKILLPRIKLLQHIITLNKIIKEYNYPEWNYYKILLPWIKLLKNITTLNEIITKYYYPG